MREVQQRFADANPEIPKARGNHDDEKPDRPDAPEPVQIAHQRSQVSPAWPSKEPAPEFPVCHQPGDQRCQQQEHQAADDRIAPGRDHQVRVELAKQIAGRGERCRPLCHAAIGIDPDAAYALLWRHADDADRGTRTVRLGGELAEQSHIGIGLANGGNQPVEAYAIRPGLNTHLRKDQPVDLIAKYRKRARQQDGREQQEEAETEPGVDRKRHARKTDARAGSRGLPVHPGALRTGRWL